MEGACGAGDRAGRSEGVTPGKPPASTGMPVPGGVEHRKAPERLPDAAGNPWELRISRRSAGSRIGEGPWGAGSKRYGSPSRGGLKRVRGKRGREPLRRSGDDVLRRVPRRPGTTAVGPGSNGFSASLGCGASDLVFLRVRGCGAPRTTVARRMSQDIPAQDPKGLRRREPRSGSGPSVSARRRREQTVGTARNREDGRCRVWKARDIRISEVDVAGGA